MVKLIPTADREHFAQQRRELGIGGSDVAPLMLNASLRPNWMDTRMEIWLDKTGRRKEKDDNAAMRRGRAMEEPTAQRYAKRTGNEVVVCPWTLVEDDCFAANIDRLVRRPGDPAPIERMLCDGESVDRVVARLILECKTASKAWGDEMPMYYYAQPQWYMGFIPECEGADVACWFGDQVKNVKEGEPEEDFAIYHFTRNQEFIDNAREVCREFWFKNVKEGIMPEPETEDECRIKWAVSGNGAKDVITATREIEEAISRIHAIDEKKTALDIERDENVTTVMKFMQNNSVLKTLSGDVMCTWKSQKPRTTVDYKGLCAKYLKPKKEWLDEFTKVGEASRPFKLKA